MNKMEGPLTLCLLPVLACVLARKTGRYWTEEPEGQDVL